MPVINALPPGRIGGTGIIGSVLSIVVERITVIGVPVSVMAVEQRWR